MGGSMGSSRTHGSIYKLLLTSRTASKAFKTEAKYDRISSNLQSLLHSAAALGDHNMCRELIEVWRYSIEQVDWMGQKPIHFALGGGHVHLFHHMVTQWSSDLGPHDSLFQTAMFSELYGQGSLLESFRVLVEDLGCDINTTNTNGRTIFHHQYFGYKVMQVVNELGLSVNWNKRDSEEETFIHSNPRWLRDPRLLIVYLQQSQLSINTRDSRGRSPLHSYCVDLPTLRSDFTFDVRMPLDFGADRHLEDSDGRTVIDGTF
ncbi:ankyrin repeat-containing domain protein [Fusarium tricinctum]|uniref:Ankyrin repeat-containing domain protein n=1 Tax=Fusarium tricinctum TaxID=61284 RepID=A0A8K0RXU7_9HYPO|nr:ankyrin repeat-containing domain protein [Fusarium tricinctum]